ncbi:MAG: metalloprotease TldD, partial [Gammaproteobacteria bacterium]|nr:metalloprotease TldD [Gammaproteobacteria bacterium]
MSNHLAIAQEALLAPAGLSENELQSVLDQIMSHSVDSADLYFQFSRHESWALEDGIVKEG